MCADPHAGQIPTRMLCLAAQDTQPNSGRRDRGKLECCICIRRGLKGPIGLESPNRVIAIRDFPSSLVDSGCQGRQSLLSDGS